MFRIAIIALLFYAIWRLWKRAGRKTVSSNSGMTTAEPSEMIACSTCGTFVMKSEAVTSRGNFYCSQSCCKS